MNLAPTSVAVSDFLKSAHLPESSTRSLDRLAIANDASHFRMVPEAVVHARSAAEIGLIFGAAKGRDLGITLRSGGTSLSGQAVSDSVLVDVRRHFREIDLLDDGRRVRVQPGATVRQVNARLAPFGRRLGPDPASESACTIGGVVANNSSGMSSGIRANTYNTLESMIYVLPSGTVIDSGAADADQRLRHEEPAIHAGLLGLRDRVRGSAASTAELRRLFALKNTLGYGLNAFLDHEDPAEILARLIIGSEGTLAFVASATYRTVPRLRHTATGLLVFDDLIQASSALPALIETGADALELMDSRSLLVGRRMPGAPARLIDLRPDRQAAVLIEFAAASADELRELVESARADLQGIPAASTADFTSDPATRAALWSVRKGLYAAIAEARPSATTALLEDVAVPVDELAATCGDLGNMFDRHGYVDSVIFGHAKDGNIHFLLTDRFASPDELARYSVFTDEMVDLVLSRGGTLKAEHGTGRVMAPFVQRQYGDELYAVMVELKRLVDPTAMLNPGVILNDDPQVHLKAIKAAPTIDPEVDRCVECGFCEPVCPSQDVTLTPRQRIVLRRAMRDAERDGDEELLAELAADYEYAGVDTCAADGMCQTACPVRINTGDLVKRLRREDQGRASDKMWASLARHWRWAIRSGASGLAAASRLPDAVVMRPNAMLRRWLGNDSVPLWSKDLPVGGRSRRRAAGNAAPAAVYLPSCVGSIFGPSRKTAGVQSSLEFLCASAGMELRVPADVDSLCCGTPWSSKGLPAGLEIMRDRLRASLIEASDGGSLSIVCDASSCTEGIGEALSGELLDARIVVVDAVEFVATHVLDRLPVRPKARSVILHPTCSSTRLAINDHLMRVAKHVADEVIVPTDWGCCAFAGDRGLLHPELTASATAREGAEVRAHEAALHASCNRTCEIGMTRATGLEYRHVLELLADALRGS